jgi:hypothetical protein
MTQMSTCRDTLFLLPPGFADNNRREYCPECAEIWGVLSYYPAIQQSVEMVYQPIDRPRPDLVARLGDKNQNCPTLILGEGSPDFENCGIMTRRGERFINNARDIGRYWAQRYGTAIPRGTGPL